MTGWQFKWDTTVIELTSDPARIIDDNIARSSDNTLGTGLPLIVALGRKPRKISIEGRLYDPAQTKAQLKTSICDPLKARVGMCVLLAQTTYYNETFLLDQATFTEEPGYTKSYTYKMTLLQGAQYVVL
jgi:hypothetical protein